jgi:hypothetical protein
MRLNISPNGIDESVRPKSNGDHSQEVQNMTCDHNCVINTGLMSERLKRACNAVRNDVISCGEGGGGELGKIDCKGMADEGARARLKVCLRDENPFAVGVDTEGCWIDGDGDRVGRGGDVVPLRSGVEPADEGVLLTFFFLLNGRRNDDQSDSNWIDSTSDAGDE